MTLDPIVQIGYSQLFTAVRDERLGVPVSVRVRVRVWVGFALSLA